MPKVQQQQRNHRIQKYLSLVQPIARRYSYQSGCDCDDLTQVGYLGLIQASQRFKLTHGNSFPAFAKPHIRGAILHYLRDHVSLVRLPRGVEERAIKIRGHDERTLNNIDQLILQNYKFKSNWKELNEECVGGTFNGSDDMELKEQNQKIKLAMKKLAKNEQIIIQLVIVEGNSLRKAGKIIGVSAMTVQRRLKRALAQLRDLLTTDQSG
jgi:RNA polymerase sigma-B factor